jgi:phosphatidylglycerophosphatase C
MKDNKTIAFFDFDGTITNRDVFWDYVLFRLKNGLPVIKVTRCLPDLFMFFCKVLDNETAKRRVFSKMFKGENIMAFKNSIDTYSLQCLPKRVRKDAHQQLLWHKAQSHEVCIVSANFNLLLNNFAIKHQVNLISTELLIANGMITGEFKTANCYGQEKVNRINNYYPNLDKYARIYSYGDSRGDREMLSIATHKYFRFFKS